MVLPEGSILNGYRIFLEVGDNEFISRVLILVGSVLYTSGVPQGMS